MVDHAIYKKWIYICSMCFVLCKITVSHSLECCDYFNKCNFTLHAGKESVLDDVASIINNLVQLVSFPHMMVFLIYCGLARYLFLP